MTFRQSWLQGPFDVQSEEPKVEGLASDVEAIKSVCFSPLKVSNAKTFLGLMAQLPGLLLRQDQAQSKSMTVGQLGESFHWALGLSLHEAWTSIFLWSFHTFWLQHESKR